MAEEQHRCQEPRLCVNNCGFFGSPATQNLCSKCYHDLHHSEQSLNQLCNAASSSTTHPVFSFSPPAVEVNNNQTNSNEVITEPAVAAVTEHAVAAPQQQQQPNRCLTCRKRVGLMGFKCRCGMVFCGMHRYPEQHGCEFDFKSSGKEQIAKANPVIKGEKLQKI